MDITQVLALIIAIQCFGFATFAAYKIGYKKGARITETSEMLGRFFNDDDSTLSAKEVDRVEFMIGDLLKKLEVDGVPPNYKTLYLVRSSDAHVMRDAAKSIERATRRDYEKHPHGTWPPPRNL